MAITAEFGIQPFQTEEEARAYRENMPIAMRSTARGPIQGLASLSGMGDIPALGERLLFGGGPKFWAPESEYKSYGESRQDYLENIGGALVPGKTVEGGVQGGQLLTELAGIGIVGKQAIDLIRKYGPQAIVKIKSIFIKNPETTVESAVNEALGMTRREVLQTGGAGIAALAAPGAVLKLGSMAVKTPVAVKGAVSFLNMMPPGAASRTATFKNLHMRDKAGEIFPPNSFWDKDWGVADGMYMKNMQKRLADAPAPVPWLMENASDHMLIASRPHFQKYGLEPNEITLVDTHNSDMLIDANLWTQGKKQQRSTEAWWSDMEKQADADNLGRAQWRDRPDNYAPKVFSSWGVEDLGTLWNTKLDLLKADSALALKPKTTNRYLGEVPLNPKEPKGTMVELFEIDGVPVVRTSLNEPYDQILFPNSKGMKRLAKEEHPDLTEKPRLSEMVADERLDDRINPNTRRAFEEDIDDILNEPGASDTVYPLPDDVWFESIKKSEYNLGGPVTKPLYADKRYI